MVNIGEISVKKILSMKLIRFGQPDSEKPGVIINYKRYDVSHLVADYNEDFFSGDALKNIEAGNLPEVSGEERLGTPLARPSKLICVGLNYKDHAAETNTPYSGRTYIVSQGYVGNR